MNVSARRATPLDLEGLEQLYRSLEQELTALKPMWDLSEGLAEPVSAALADLLSAPDARIYVGVIDDVAFGFLLGLFRELLPQAHGDRVAVIKFIFTEHEAREVGVAEAMMQAFVADARADGIERFDAHVSPGHRLAKNFFESNGFKARHIVMYSGPETD